KRISIDVITTRTQYNFNYLNQKLKKYSFFKQHKNIDFAPAFFPLVLPDSIPAPFFITALRQQGILCGRISNHLKEVGSLTLLMNKIILLPCNHQVSQEDIEHVANEVLKIFSGDSKF